MRLADIFYPHDPMLVIVSLTVAVLAAYVSLDFARLIRTATGLARWAILAAAAGAMGAGIWSMHFIAMLALMLPVPVTYNAPLTVLSVFVPVLFAAVGFYLSFWQQMSWLRVLLGGTAIGSGIAAMHYIGMAAIRMPAIASYEPLPVALSILIAIGASSAALWITWISETIVIRLCGSSLGLAIAGMHYTGMAGFICTPAKDGHLPLAGLSPAGLAPWVAGVSLVLLWNMIVFSAYSRKVERLNREAMMEEALNTTRAELSRVGRLMMMGELTASIAHELNQPLGAIVINASACRRWLAQQPPNMDKMLHSVDLVIRDANRASEVIKRISDFVRRQAPESSPIDINDAIREVLALARSEIERRRVFVRTELTTPLPPVTAERVAFQQVMLNLLMNAMEAMAAVEDRSRELLIRSELGGPGHVLVSVRDTGTGLDANNEERIFEPFFTTKTGGTGIGLALSRSIIEAYGGRIRASPATPYGAVFELTLPAVAGAAS
jgi:NO-binding membrane sensor protein with MHYT domain/nitrogen-specific signal transduction histidine kinase